MKEEWRVLNILGLDYNISDTGKIISLVTNTELKQRPTVDGYLEVTVGKYYCRRTSRRVHTLVASAFIPKPNTYDIFEVNHKDLDRTNNNVDNLEWLTHQDNISYSVKLGSYDGSKMIGENNPNFGNDTLKKKYASNPELSKIKNSRPREQNGRCVKVKMTDVIDDKVYIFNFIGECAEFLRNNFDIQSSVNSLRTTITIKIKDNKLYIKRFKFEEVV